MSLVGFRAPQSTEAARRNERGTRVRKGLGPFRQGLVVEVFDESPHYTDRPDALERRDDRLGRGGLAEGFLVPTSHYHCSHSTGRVSAVGALVPRQ